MTKGLFDLGPLPEWTPARQKAYVRFEHVKMYGDDHALLLEAMVRGFVQVNTVARMISVAALPGRPFTSSFSFRLDELGCPELCGDCRRMLQKLLQR